MARAKSTSTEALVKAKPDKAAEGPPCPKCHSTKGWSGPHYQRGTRVEVKRPKTPTAFYAQVVETNESLAYTCSACGYTRHEACKDL